MPPAISITAAPTRGPIEKSGGDHGNDRMSNTIDLETGTPEFGASSMKTHPMGNETTSSNGINNRLRASWRNFLQHNFEARGITRVLPSERHDSRRLGFTQIMMMWLGINLAANNIVLGMLGPTVFYLPFLDSCLCAVFGMLLGSLPVAYIATFGPRSGNRSMVLARYTVGWWPAKLIVILNLIVLLGYSTLDAVIAGQILSAVSTNGQLSVVVGVIIVSGVTWLVTTFGYSVFHIYERYAWLPQLIVTCVLAGVAGPQFDLYGNPSKDLDQRAIAGNRLSFFSLNFAAAITYAGVSADYLVYYPESTSRWRLFTAILVGLSASFTLAFVVGIGLGSGIASNPDWSTAYDISQGALIVEGFRPLGGFGKFSSVVVGLGLIANMVAPTYSSGVDFQVLGHSFERVPRVILNTIGVVIYTVCACVGRAHLAQLFTNFLALMGYWVTIWIAIVLEEHVIFRKWLGLGWDWEAWNDARALPVGGAALLAFLVGWVGAILSMAQVWYVGPLAKLASGADMGNYVGFAWAALVYGPVRWLELRKFGR